LTRDKGSIRKYPNKEVGILSNILIDDLFLNPTLITNYIQYSTPSHILSFIDKKNQTKFLFGQKFIVRNE